MMHWSEEHIRSRINKSSIELDHLSIAKWQTTLLQQRGRGRTNFGGGFSDRSDTEATMFQMLQKEKMSYISPPKNVKIRFTFRVT